MTNEQIKLLLNVAVPIKNHIVKCCEAVSQIKPDSSPRKFNRYSKDSEKNHEKYVALVKDANPFALEIIFKIAVSVIDDMESENVK